MIAWNMIKSYLKLYRHMNLGQIEESMRVFHEAATERGIAIDSSNRNKYLSGWLMRENEYRRYREIEKLQAENEQLAEALLRKENALENESHMRQHYVDRTIALQRKLDLAVKLIEFVKREESRFGSIGDPVILRRVKQALKEIGEER